MCDVAINDIGSTFDRDFFLFVVCNIFATKINGGNKRASRSS